MSKSFIQRLKKYLLLILFVVLINDTFEQLKFLNTLPLPVLEDSITIFRENIFSMTDRRKIPHLIYDVVQRELIEESKSGIRETQSNTNHTLTVEQLLADNKDQAALFEVSKRIYESLQVVLEFMDKGVKGLLTGDLSVPLIQEMQIKIQGFQEKFERLSNEINTIIQKQETLDQVISEHFKIDHLIELDRGVYERNLPKYTTIAHNF